MTRRLARPVYELYLADVPGKPRLLVGGSRSLRRVRESRDRFYVGVCGWSPADLTIRCRRTVRPSRQTR